MRTKASLLAQGRLLSVACLIFMLSFARGANAELYQWEISIPGEPKAFFPSYAAACQYYFDNTSKNWLKKIEKMNPKWIYCSVSGTGGIVWESKA
ncbi:RHS repeat protein, partial [Pseudomonas aeruginosa]|nr:RHS repeat protein [Pseudomonas aeruginosa]